MVTLWRLQQLHGVKLDFSVTSKVFNRIILQHMKQAIGNIPLQKHARFRKKEIMLRPNNFFEILEQSDGV